jgi:uncharacterized protein with NAD-binding domain and iron-sulfur cluster
MGAQPDREKVAVLGGGPAAVTAAFELTATPALRERFEVTIYQPGWRMGGKCASGRNLARGRGARIEEHGLHVWFGFYENAFSLMRAAYEELHRPASMPLASIEEAFKGCNDLVLYDRQDEGWHAFPLTFPTNDLTPGAGHELPGFWDIAAQMCDWAIARWEALAAEAPDRVPGTRPRALTPGWLLDLAFALGVGVGLDPAHGGEQLLYLARHLTRANPLIALAERLPSPLATLPLPGAAPIACPARALAALLSGFRDWLWDHVVSERCAGDPDLRMFFTVFDTFASATAGIVRDGVLEHGWDAINDRELCEWLSEHGAKPVTVGATPEQRSPLLRAIYDVAFGYPDGLIARANVAAGTAVNDLLRLGFSYRGSVMYKMQAGMGDTVLTPLYEVLTRRGVKVEFFHSVTELRLADDGTLVDAIELVPQVKLERGAYDPLVAVEGLPCWPSEPLWEQLHEGEKLRSDAVNFELEDNPLRRRPRTLRRGRDFDTVVLGIPVGALEPICGEIAKRHPRFRRMLRSSATVRTQAFQLWLTQPTSELGWTHGQDSVVGCYVEPLDTWCDMSHLLARERWSQSSGVRGIAYFCGVLDDRGGEDHTQATARVKDNALAFAHTQIGPLWPRAVGRDPNGPIEWKLLAGSGRRLGPARLDAQYWRANTTPSERYVLTPAGSVDDRLAAEESGVENLVLAGDWTRNGIDGGCVEAAMTSGMQAARALIGHDRRYTGESPTWLTDGGVARGGRPASGARR